MDYGHIMVNGEQNTIIRIVCQCGVILHKNKKGAVFCRVFLMVVGQGFEPWKAMPTDLQAFSS